MGTAQGPGSSSAILALQPGAAGLLLVPGPLLVGGFLRALGASEVLRALERVRLSRWQRARWSKSWSFQADFDR